jgi:hypothetical protein
MYGGRMHSSEYGRNLWSEALHIVTSVANESASGGILDENGGPARATEAWTRIYGERSMESI